MAKNWLAFLFLTKETRFVWFSSSHGTALPLRIDDTTTVLASNLSETPIQTIAYSLCSNITLFLLADRIPYKTQSVEE